MRPWQALAQMPEWYIVNAALGGLCLLGLSWRPLLWLLPLFGLGVLLPLVQILAAVGRTEFSRPGLRVLTAGLFILQPIARLWGRFAYGLTPWRWQGARTASPLPSFTDVTWSETWRAAPEWLERLRAKLHASGLIAQAGGDYDRWDFEIRVGLSSSARLRIAVEEHGGGKQLLRWRVWPHPSRLFLVTMAMPGALALGAALGRAPIAAGALSACVILMMVRAWLECSRAIGSARAALEKLQ